MTMSLLGIGKSAGGSVFYVNAFRAVFEDHIELYRSTVKPQEVTAEDAWMYRYRPYWYFNILGIEPQFHHYVMRINYWKSPQDFDETVREMYLPDWNVLRKLATNYSTVFAST